MKNDTQHLEFLISQYVDGTLDPASKKTMEQQLLTDPVARTLLKEHRETQDLLDDWGNRLPLINWNEFDNKLAERLEKEAPEVPVVAAPWRKWIRPAAIAASLFLAVGTGYVFRAMQGGGTQIADPGTPGSPLVKEMSVAVERPDTLKRPGRSTVSYPELPARTAVAGKVEISDDPLKAIQRGQAEGDPFKLAPRPSAVNAAAPAPEPDGIIQ